MVCDDSRCYNLADDKGGGRLLEAPLDFHVEHWCRRGSVRTWKVLSLGLWEHVNVQVTC